MALPRAVREQAERADRLLQEANGNTAPATPTEAPAAPAEPTPQPPAEVVQEPAPQPPAAQEDDGSFRLKYLTLQGKYNKEVPALASENRDLKNEVADLKRQIEELKQSAPAAAAADTSLTPESVVSTYGEDFAAAVSTVAQAQVAKIRDEISSDVKVLKESAAQRVRSDFIRDLAALVPNWQQVDADPGFTAFLDQFDPMTGRVRREFFNEADASNDAARIAVFFDSYVKSKPRAQQPAAPQPTPSVDHLIAPDSSAQSVVQEGKKLWSPAEIRQFYSDARAGRYKPAEYAAIDADISAASAEGRILD